MIEKKERKKEKKIDSKYCSLMTSFESALSRSRVIVFPRSAHSCLGASNAEQVWNRFQWTKFLFIRYRQFSVNLWFVLAGCYCTTQVSHKMTTTNVLLQIWAKKKSTSREVRDFFVLDNRDYFPKGSYLQNI